jgi:hypothetical protein
MILPYKLVTLVKKLITVKVPIYQKYIEGSRKHHAANFAHGRILGLRHIVSNLYNEIIEMNAEIRAMNFKNAKDEFFDVFHLILKFIMVALHLDNFEFPWTMLFVLATPTATKMGLRYLNHGCVRNKHHCDAKNHSHFEIHVSGATLET